MVKDNKENLKKVGVGAIIGLIAGGLGGGLYADDSSDVNAFSDKVETLKAEKLVLINANVALKNSTPKEIEVERNVTVEVEVEVEKIVEVDNGNLDLVLDHIYDNKGDVEYLLKDLDDDELNQIVDRVVFINDITSLAVEEVKNEFADLINKEVKTFGNETVKFDDDDIERVRVQDDEGDVDYFDVDFEDGDADVKVEVKFEQDDVKYTAFVNVEFKDGKIEDLDLDSIELR